MDDETQVDAMLAKLEHAIRQEEMRRWRGAYWRARSGRTMWRGLAIYLLIMTVGLTIWGSASGIFGDFGILPLVIPAMAGSVVLNILIGRGSEKRDRLP